jgi:anti-sigma factor RsiW
MSGRILSFAKSPHQKVQELLPWFLNGTLESEDVAQVDEHLKSCPACRSELECLQVLRSTYVDTEIAPDAEAALARLRPRLEERAPASRPRRTGERTRASPARMPSWLGLALAAQFALILGLGWKVLQPDRAALEFHALSSAATAEHAAGSLVVVFNPGASQREVARILHRSGGRVVDGPTESNGFVLAVASGNLKDALTRLRAEPAVVLAEPLEAERTP